MQNSRHYLNTQDRQMKKKQTMNVLTLQTSQNLQEQDTKNSKEISLNKQGRIHGSPVAGGWAGAVMAVRSTLRQNFRT